MEVTFIFRPRDLSSPLRQNRPKLFNFCGLGVLRFSPWIALTAFIIINIMEKREISELLFCHSVLEAPTLHEGRTEPTPT